MLILRFKIRANLKYSKTLIMNSSISLIGMAGAGKSSVGIKLAETLNLQFVDSDSLIEKNFNQNLQSIFDDLGYLKLRSIE